MQAIKAAVRDSLLEGVDFQLLRTSIERGAERNFVSQATLEGIYAEGISSYVVRVTSDHQLTSEDSSRVIEFASAFDVDLAGAAGRDFHKALVLKALDEGSMSEVWSHKSSVASAIRFAQDEGLIYAFVPCVYHSMRERAEYQGASQGISIRLAKGVYYRVGSSRGEAIQSQYLRVEGTGALAISNKALYFLSSTKTVKIPLQKVMAVQMFDDAIQISRDGINAKPHIFGIDDPAFAVNLLARVVS